MWVKVRAPLTNRPCIFVKRHIPDLCVNMSVGISDHLPKRHHVGRVKGDFFKHKAHIFLTQWC